MNLNFENKTVLITGASQGIGFGVSQIFLNNGANVIMSSRHPESLSRAINNIQCNKQSKISSLKCDITNRSEVSCLTNFVIEKHGGIDALIQCAGIYPTTSTLNIDFKELDNVINTNLIGTINIVCSFLPIMKKQSKGKIVMISSITGPTVGNSLLPHYSASKAGLNGFLKSSAIELAQYNVNINAIEPGNINTKSLEKMNNNYAELHLKAIPMKRFGKPEDIANTALFLCSDYSSFITGQSIIVDGGQTLPETHFLP